MKRIRSLIPIAVALISASALAAGPDPGVNVTVTNPPSKPVPVSITNTPANPVPVTGSTTVSGAVSISGTVPVTQSGTWNVGVAGTLNTKNIDERGRNPYSVHTSCTSSGGNSCIAPTAPIPAGKRFVIEYANASMQVRTTPGVEGVQSLLLFIDGTPIQVALSPRFIGSFDGDENYRASEPVLIFVEAGQVMSASLSSWLGNVSGDVFLSGYLIDLSK